MNVRHRILIVVLAVAGIVAITSSLTGPEMTVIVGPTTAGERDQDDAVTPTLVEFDDPLGDPISVRAAQVTREIPRQTAPAINFTSSPTQVSPDGGSVVLTAAH